MFVGRRFFAATLAFLAGVYQCGSHVLFLDYVQMVYQLQLNQLPTRVPSKLRALVQEVMEESGMTDEQVKLGNVFIGGQPEVRGSQYP